MKTNYKHNRYVWQLYFGFAVLGGAAQVTQTFTYTGAPQSFTVPSCVSSISVTAKMLVTVALVDLLIFFFTGRCLVCYRCRSEFRDVPISRDQRGWDLATGEKYRDIPPPEPETPPPAASQDHKS